MRVIKDGRVPVKIWDGDGAVPMDPNTIEQALALSRLRFVHSHVALMPDAHWGMGSTVGSVVATKHAVIPAAVGVDIGCGMLAQPLDRHVDWLLEKPAEEFRREIENAVPHGRTDNGRPDKDTGAWLLNPPDWIRAAYDRELRDGLDEIMERYRDIFARGKTKPHTHAWNMLGTLGTGNHFIELAVDEDDMLWIVLHSGSRGIGARVANFFMKAAKARMELYGIEMPDPNLAFFPKGDPNFDAYWMALQWAQRYAWLNREAMLQLTEQAIGAAGDRAKLVHCHHNYATWENHFGENVIVTRKGATRAREGDMGIIPGSMGARTFVVRGLGNPQSFDSCSHGAGRVMSRAKARREISLEQHIRDTAGVVCKKGEDVLDESPRAYKDIDAVMAAQTDLVEPVAILKQVVCVKG